MKKLFVPVPEKAVKLEREKARQLKKTAWWRDKLKQGFCYHCGKKFKTTDLSMDHLTPLARGGKTGKNNVVVSCKKCNKEKSFKTLVELRLQKS